MRGVHATPCRVDKKPAVRLDLPGRVVICVLKTRHGLAESVRCTGYRAADCGARTPPASYQYRYGERWNVLPGRDREPVCGHTAAGEEGVAAFERAREGWPDDLVRLLHATAPAVLLYPGPDEPEPEWE